MKRNEEEWAGWGSREELNDGVMMEIWRFDEI